MTQRHNRKAAAKVRVESNELHASGREPHETGSLFAAEAAYADSIFRGALGDSQGCIDALRRSIECMPTYAMLRLFCPLAQSSTSWVIRQRGGISL